jgi:hypothetical protein
VLGLRNAGWVGGGGSRCGQGWGTSGWRGVEGGGREEVDEGRTSILRTGVGARLPVKSTWMGGMRDAGMS